MMQLRYGLSRAVPEGVLTAWGARLVAPSTMLYDRQDMISATDADRHALAAWLDGGALRGAICFLREKRLPESYEVVTVFDDPHGVIVGSTCLSFGYVYLAGWLKLERPESEVELAGRSRMTIRTRRIAQGFADRLRAFPMMQAGTPLMGCCTPPLGVTARAADISGARGSTG